MSKVYMILAMVILIAVALFAVTNNQAVAVNMLGFARWESNVAVLILVSFAAGAVLMAVFDLGRSIRKWRGERQSKSQAKAIEEERDALRQRVEQLRAELDRAKKQGGEESPDQ